MPERHDPSGEYRSVDGVDILLDGPVLHCTLDRVKTRNALDDDMLRALIDGVETASQDERVRVIAITGNGDHFCAGADIIARNAPTDAKPRVGSIQRRLPAQAHRLVPLLLSVQTPVVTSVRGFAAGIGFHLALASDFCVASESARFWEPFLARGFTPDSGGAWLLPRLAGTTLAREMILLGRELSGAEAAAQGLIHCAVPDPELDTATEALVQRLAESPTVALGLAKWLMFTGAALPLDAHLANEAFALELSSRSQDFREGLAAFREKRDPDFTGR